MESIRQISKERLQELLDTSSSIEEVCQKLGIKKISSVKYSKALQKQIIELNVSVDKFEQNRKKAGRKGGVRKPIEMVLCKNGPKLNGRDLKRRLIFEGLRKDLCEKCGIGPVWNGMKLTLQLEHKNGDHFDNREENLSILCPNCHSQTHTYGRNMKWRDSQLIENLIEEENKEAIQTHEEKEVDSVVTTIEKDYVGVYKHKKGGWECKAGRKYVKYFLDKDHCARYRDLYLMQQDLEKQCGLNFVWSVDEIEVWKAKFKM